MFGMTTAEIRDAIVAAANRYGLAPSLALAVCRRESDFDPSAVSGAGAIGLFQLMPATAQELGVDPRDPLQNIDGGVRYLVQLATRYHMNVPLTLAAYNAGPGEVDRFHGGIPPFVETIHYVSNILFDFYATHRATPDAPASKA